MVPCDLDRSDTAYCDHDTVDRPSKHLVLQRNKEELLGRLRAIQIGPSALVGMSLFVLLTPLQTWFMKLSFKVRQSSIVSYRSECRICSHAFMSLHLRSEMDRRKVEASSRASLVNGYHQAVHL